MVTAVLWLFCMISAITGSQIRDSYAFWTYSKPGDDPQHMRITQLVRYPHDELFLRFWRMMARWSEEPDAGKDSLFGHGDELFRGNQSLDAAVDHYRMYLKDHSRLQELEIAAQCLAHAFHYYEDMADFSEGNVPLRRAVARELTYLSDNYQWTRDQIDNKKRDIQANRDSIISVLRQIKGQRISDRNSERIRDSLVTIIASLEQMDMFFLNAAHGRLQPPHTATSSGACQRECIQWREVWKNVSDNRHSLCAGGVPKPPGPGMLPPKCELSRQCIKWETRCR